MCDRGLWVQSNLQTLTLLEEEITKMGKFSSPIVREFHSLLILFVAAQIQEIYQEREWKESSQSRCLTFSVAKRNKSTCVQFAMFTLIPRSVLVSAFFSVAIVVPKSCTSFLKIKLKQNCNWNEESKIGSQQDLDLKNSNECVVKSLPGGNGRNASLRCISLVLNKNVSNPSLVSFGIKSTKSSWTCVGKVLPKKTCVNLPTKRWACKFLPFQMFRVSNVSGFSTETRKTNSCKITYSLTQNVSYGDTTKLVDHLEMLSHQRQNIAIPIVHTLPPNFSEKDRCSGKPRFVASLEHKFRLVWMVWIQKYQTKYIEVVRRKHRPEASTLSEQSRNPQSVPFWRRACLMKTVFCPKRAVVVRVVVVVVVCVCVCVCVCVVSFLHEVNLCW